ncbi:MAG: putative rRNA maturation factor [Deferribacteres bacterium]|nr:putative rRNA maturation factor [Deferribacteres bacterium]
MKTEIYLTDEVNSGLSNEFIGYVIKKTLLDAGVTKNVKVSVLITNDDGIRKLNNQYRGIDKPTDVLSFPMYASIDEISENDLVGDIVISFDTLKRQALENEINNDREAAFLIIHGMLHLLGFDHILEEEENIMYDLQESILKNLVEEGFVS